MVTDEFLLVLYYPSRQLYKKRLLLSLSVFATLGNLTPHIFYSDCGHVLHLFYSVYKETQASL